MNAYFASFMLLLFNAVGLAVPASAAAAERMIPELGSAAANRSEAGIADPSSVIEMARLGSSDHQSCAMVESCLSAPRAMVKTGNKTPVWAVVVIRTEAGDKLEHEEGAP